MSFAEDLWDRFDQVNKRVEDAITVYRDMANFFDKRSKLESEFSKKLVSLCKKSGNFKGNTLTGSMGTIGDSWVKVQEETEKLAKFHQDFSSKLEAEVVQKINAYCKDFEKKRQQIEKEGKKNGRDLKNQISALQKAKAQYDKAGKDADDAIVASEKAQQDPNMKQKQLQSFSVKATQAQEKLKQMHAEYKEQLEETNNYQEKYHSELMPQVLAEFQSMEEERIEALDGIMKKFLLIQEAVPPCIELVCQTISQSVSAISMEDDIKLFIEDTKTGELPPPPFEYEPYEGRDGDPTQSGGKDESEDTSLSILNDNEDLSSLPEDEQKEKLKKKIDECQKSIRVALKERKSLDQMVDLYEGQPDTKNQVQNQLADVKQKIQSLKDKKREWESKLRELQGGEPEPEEEEEGGEQEVLCQVEAIYDYEAQDESELSFKSGDVMNVVNEYQGWWQAELNGKYGLIPNTYVRSLE